MAENALIEYLDSPKFVAASANATRLVAKLKTAVQKQELYETHQILRTIYFRFINSKEKIPALVELLYQGSCYLFKFQEFVSSQDAATLFLETAAKHLQSYREEGGNEAQASLTNYDLAHHSSNMTMDWEICTKVSNIAVNLPDSEVGQSKFIAEALKILTPKLLNRDLLHHVMARRFWEQKDFFNTRYNFLHCASLENAQDIAKLLIEYHNQAAAENEVDLFITQFIFQLLCLQRPTDPPPSSNQRPSTSSSTLAPVSPKPRSSIKTVVSKIFSTYTKDHPSLSQVSEPYATFPLLNFTNFLISLLDSNQEAGTFKMLCKIYKPVSSRDPKYESYLIRIGTIYFGIVDPSKQQQQGGFFNNILMSLLDGSGEDGDESPSPRPGATNLSSCDELD